LLRGFSALAEFVHESARARLWNTWCVRFVSAIPAVSRRGDVRGLKRMNNWFDRDAGLRAVGR
jgi:hypothetical protein